MRVNGKGVFFCLQRVARAMIPRRSGVIVNIASIAGKGYAGASNVIYAGSKGAVISMTRMAALQLAPHNINVNAICPGTTVTALSDANLRTRAATRACRSRRWSGGGTPPSRSAGRTSPRTSPRWRPSWRHPARGTSPDSPSTWTAASSSTDGTGGSHGRRAGPLRRDAHPARPALHPPRSVPAALVRKVLEAGTRAPSGGNQQRWRFIVIKDAETKRWIQQRCRNTPVPATRCRERGRGQDHGAQRRGRQSPGRASPRSARAHPVLPPARRLAERHQSRREHLSTRPEHAPGRAEARPRERPDHPAAPRLQNEIKEKLGIPDNVDTAALLPLGYPAAQNRYGPTNRRPVEDVTFSRGAGAGRGRPGLYTAARASRARRSDGPARGTLLEPPRDPPGAARAPRGRA